MHATMTRNQIIDFIKDMIVFKTGISIDKDELLKYIKDINTSFCLDLINLKPENYIRFTPDLVEDIISEIRIKIGNIDEKNVLMSDIFFQFEEFNNEFNLITKFWGKAIDWHKETYGNKYPLGREFVNYISSSLNISEMIVNIYLMQMIRVLNRGLSYNVVINNWDGVIKLSDLFNSEDIPENKNYYLDQRYIDYLSKNTENLYKMNWRKFEALTAEFFKRQGYIVNIGKGRSDGGIDLLVKNSNNSENFIIQCKRFDKNNKVSIETIKALYFDIGDKKADKGLIVTTSTISKGGNAIIAKYHNSLTKIEHENLKNWLNSMETTVKL